MRLSNLTIMLYVGATIVAVCHGIQFHRWDLLIEIVASFILIQGTVYIIDKKQRKDETRKV